ncbi:MAG: hypothetical protein WA813_23775 [Beijerinckiaceae bacterium]
MSRRARSVALLVGAAALIFQLFLAPWHAPLVRAASASPQSAALATLAELAALTGNPNVLCADMGDGRPGDPAHDMADCPGLCCHLSHGLAFFLPPPAFSPAIPSRIFVAISGPRPILLVASAQAPSAQPRGPPLSA